MGLAPAPLRGFHVPALSAAILPPNPTRQLFCCRLLDPLHAAQMGKPVTQPRRHQMCTNCHAKQAWTIFNMISFRCVQYHQGWSVRSQAVLMALGVLTTSTGCPTNCSRLLSQLFLFVFECLGSMNNFQAIILSVLITSNARPTNRSRILFAG